MFCCWVYSLSFKRLFGGGVFPPEMGGWSVGVNLHRVRRAVVIFGFGDDFEPEQVFSVGSESAHRGTTIVLVLTHCNPS